MSSFLDPAGVMASQLAFDQLRQKADGLAAEVKQLQAEVAKAAQDAKDANAKVQNAMAPPPAYNSNKNAQAAVAAMDAAKAAQAKAAAMDAKIAELEQAVKDMDAAHKADIQKKMAAARAKKAEWGVTGLARNLVNGALAYLPNTTPGAVATCPGVTVAAVDKARDALKDAKAIRTGSQKELAAAVAAKDQAVDKRVKQLRLEGHGPQRHLDPDDFKLGARVLYKIDPETGQQREYDPGAVPPTWDKHACANSASAVKSAEDYVLAEAKCREDMFTKAGCALNGAGKPDSAGFNPVEFNKGSKLPMSTVFPGRNQDTIAKAKTLKDPLPSPPGAMWAKVDPAQGPKQVKKVPLNNPGAHNYPPVPPNNPPAAAVPVDIVPQLADMNKAAMEAAIQANTENKVFDPNGAFQAFYAPVDPADPCKDFKLKTMWPE